MKIESVARNFFNTFLKDCFGVLSWEVARYGALMKVGQLPAFKNNKIINKFEFKIKPFSNVSIIFPCNQFKLNSLTQKLVDSFLSIWQLQKSAHLLGILFQSNLFQDVYFIQQRMLQMLRKISASNSNLAEKQVADGRNGPCIFAEIGLALS